MSALRGLVVVETAEGPLRLAGRWLADLGAEVRTIEPPGGAATRRAGDAWAHYFEAGKRSIAADLAREPERVRELVASADLWLDSSGHDLAPSEEANSRLVRLQGEWPDGPSLFSEDLTVQLASGLADANRIAEGPARAGIGLPAVHLIALQATIGALLALLERERSGCGQTMTIEPVAAVRASLDGSTGSSRAFRVVRTRDGHAVVGVAGDWATLRGWLAEHGQANDLTAEPRPDDSAVLTALERLAATLTGAELLAGAQLRRLPFAPVVPIRAVLDDPQLAARRFFAAALPGGERLPGPAFRMSQAPQAFDGPRPWPAAAGAGRRALDGLRVLDFTHVVAGPIATRTLADHGADVLKVEHVRDVPGEDRRSGAFARLNRGKRSLAIDLRDPRGRAIVHRLAARSDVIVDNFSPRVMDEWNLDPESLRRARPEIIAASLSGFGRSGPRRDFVSFAPTLHALAGSTARMTDACGEPAGWGFPYADVCAGLHGTIAILAALVHRARTGEGSAIDLSQLEALLASTGPVGGALDEPRPQRIDPAAAERLPTPDGSPGIRLSRTPGDADGAAPLRGEHGPAVLEELGLSPAEIADLRDSGVIRR